MQFDPTTLEIVTHPDPTLRTPAEPLEHVDETVQAVVSRMLELMRDAEGIGLAAPQVGLPWRLFVTRDPEGDPCGVTWINPVLETVDPALQTDEEGCLSLPGILVNVNRVTGVRIRGLDLQGEPIEAESNQHIARVWQHELDHLNGILIIDRMSSMDRLKNRRAIQFLEGD